MESPTVMCSSLFPANFHTGTNAGQILKSDHSFCLKSLIDKTSAYFVVHVGLKPSLPSGQPFQKTGNASRLPLCLGLLERFSSALEFVSRFGEFFPIPCFAVGGGGDAPDSHIHPQTAAFLGGKWRIWKLDLDVDVPLSIAGFSKDSRRWTLSGKKISLILPENERDLDSSVNRRNTNLFLFFVKGKNSLIEIDGRRFDGRIDSALHLENSGSPRNGPDSKVGRKTELFPDEMVRKMVDTNVTGSLGLSSLIQSKIASLGERNKSAVQYFNLLFGRINFAFHCQNVHTFILLSYMRLSSLFNRKESAFLPGVNAEVSNAHR